MTILVALTDNPEGAAALRAAIDEATTFSTALIVVNLTNSDIDLTEADGPPSVQVVVPPRSDLDEVEQVLAVADAAPDAAAPDAAAPVSRIVVGVRRRSPIGKVVLGSIAQRLILEAPVPVLTVKA